MATTVPTADSIRRLARDRLGFDQLRPGQLEAISAAAAGRSVVAVLPTGAGKSAIYELAGLLRTGPTVVVSPLIALEDDQVAASPRRWLVGHRPELQVIEAGSGGGALDGR